MNRRAAEYPDSWEEREEAVLDTADDDRKDEP